MDKAIELFYILPKHTKILCCEMRTSQMSVLETAMWITKTNEM